MGMKGIVMTLDAIIAMMLMVSIISLLIFFRTESSSPFFAAQQLHSLSEDSLNILSKSTLREIASPDILNQAVNVSHILDESDLDKSAIDVIGMLWTENKPEGAANITKDILENILPNNIGYQVLINKDSVYNSSQGTGRPSYEDATTEISSGRIASGYQKGQNFSTGCVARAYLKSLRINDSSYVYFGGYVGDGNITVNITLPIFDKILEAYMEMDAGSNFTLYINNIYAGNYSNGTAGGGLMRADKWVVCNTTYNYSICSKFVSGNNTLNFTLNNSFIGGGYFRLTYNTTQTTPQQGPGNDTYWFPGITGFFNLYDSFYVPGTLTNMTSYLHYFNNLTYNQTNATVYLNIGNVTVFLNNSTGEQKINLSFYNISQYFGNQQNLINTVSNNTVPLRIGFEEFQVKPGVGTADAVLITDVSGSMGSSYDVQPGNQQRLAAAKITDNVFVDTVLGTSGNRVGLVSYSDSVSRTHPLSNNSVTLKGNISRYQANGCTCISCGVYNATKMLDADTGSRFKGLLVMSDGLANTCLLGTDCGIYGNSGGCPGDTYDPNSPPKLEAINFSCEARSKNYTVFSVGFGLSADNITLQRVACWNCSACKIDLDCNYNTRSTCRSHAGCNWTNVFGGGSQCASNQLFNSSCWIGNVTLPNGTQADCKAVRYAQSNNLDELTQIYQGFGQWFAYLGYVTQKANISGIVNFNNVLYPDSHIDLQYSPVIIPYQYGEISLTRESPRLGELTGNNTTTGNNTYKEGWFNVSNQVKVVDAKITSYSSDYWTEMLWVNSSATGSWKGVYNLTQYGNDYTSLGDPFMVNIPADKISSGNNSVRIETGFPFNGTINKTGGSPDDRVIYTLRVNSSVGYGNVNESCEGAVEDAKQRLLNITGGLVSGDVQNEISNISSVQYMWGPAIVRIRVWS
jgi:hypothetical protein